MENQMNSGGHEENKKCSISGFSQMQVFAFGIVAAIMVLCTIGFFILLGITLKSGKTGNVANNNANQPTANVAAAAQQPDPVITVPGIRSDDHVLGDKNAKVTIIEYSDFECPFCDRFHKTLVQVMDKYKKDVRLVYRHYPLPIHPQANSSAEASECASEQGKFWEFHDEIFNNQTRLGTDLYKELAQKLNLNMSKFNDCVSSRKYKAKVEASSAEGNSAGIQGTPFSAIMANGQSTPVNGAYPVEYVNSIIDGYLK